MRLYYDGKLEGKIVTNQSLTIEQACDMLNIDLDSDEYDPELFEMSYEDRIDLTIERGKDDLEGKETWIITSADGNDTGHRFASRQEAVEAVPVIWSEAGGDWKLRQEGDDNLHWSIRQ